MVKNKKRTGAVVVLLVLASLIAISVVSLLTVVNSPTIGWNEDTSITSAGTYIINTTADLAPLNNQWAYAHHVIVDPTNDISGTISNFSQVALKDFKILSSGYSINIVLNQVNISRLMEIHGTPSVTLTDGWIGTNLIFYDSPTLTLTNVHVLGAKLGVDTIPLSTDPMMIGTPNLDMDGVWVNELVIVVSGGTCLLENTDLTSAELTLVGFTSLTMNNVNVNNTANLTKNGNVALDGCIFNQTLDLGLSGAANIAMTDSTTKGRTTLGAGTYLTSFSNSNLNELYVYSDSNTTIQTTSVTTLVELIKPTLAADNSYIVPYTFLFQGSKNVEITWAGYDNIQGSGYEVTYNLTIIKNGVPIDTISQTTTSYTLKMQTASSYIIQLICIDSQGNVSPIETISIVSNPSLLPFILMILGITGGTIGAILILYWRKQRQWQKTSLMEIPTG